LNRSDGFSFQIFDFLANFAIATLDRKRIVLQLHVLPKMRQREQNQKWVKVWLNT
jgi:hypothetical protein